MTGRNPWVVLGVLEDAPYHEIQREFRRRVKQTHPDNGGDASEFTAVVQAFEAVRNAHPVPRRQGRAHATPYDCWLRSSHPTRFWLEDGRLAPVEIRRPAAAWATPLAGSANDFSNILLGEISKVQAAAGHAA